MLVMNLKVLVIEKLYYKVGVKLVPGMEEVSATVPKLYSM